MRIAGPDADGGVFGGDAHPVLADETGIESGISSAIAGVSASNRAETFQARETYRAVRVVNALD
jgi:hypothetical protein